MAEPVDALMQKVLSSASTNPAFQQLMQYLQTSGKVPDMKADYLGEGVRGAYITPGYTDKKYSKPTIVLDDLLIASRPQAAVSTLIHELTHAADSSMYSQAMDKKAGTQFKEAHGKLREDFSKRYSAPGRIPAVETARKLDPQWLFRNEDYRATSDELHSFAVGNSAVPQTRLQSGPAHLDATLATELMILLDLAQRDLQSRNKK